MAEALPFTEIFTITSENPLLRDHVVYGRNLLPGVGYVDLVLQVLARHGHAMADVEFRNLTILAPLAAAPGERISATVEGRPAPTGGWRIEVRSRRGQEADVLHASATVHRARSEAFAERLSMPLTGVERKTSLAEIYGWLRQHALVHSGLMRVDGAVHHRRADLVVELELPSASQAGADGFLFHPALFEAGLLGGSVDSHMLHRGGAGDPGEALYLPIVFESFRATAPLGRRCFVRVAADSTGRDDELIRLGAEFYDASGMKIAEVGRLAAKRVRTKAALDVRGAAAPQAAVPRAGVAGRDVVTVLRELVAARLDMTPAEVGSHTGYYELGLTSASLVALVGELEERFAVELSPTVVFEYTTIAELAAWLEEHLAQAGRPAGVAPSAGALAGPPDTAPAGSTAVPYDELAEEIAAVLCVSTGQVDPGADWAELGFDPVTLSALVERLNDRYGLTLTTTALVAQPTVRALAEHLLAQRGARPDAPDADTDPHPMLHRVLPLESGAAYETRFDGNESYLRDHMVRGARVLPGVAHLELARAAAARFDGPAAHRVRLEDVVWLRPAFCGPDGLELRVTVRQTADGAEFGIAAPQDDDRPYCQGRARLADDRDGDSEDEPGALETARAGCTGAKVSAARVYELFARFGQEYGPGQRSLTGLQTGTDAAGRPQALAELLLPAAADSLPGCLLHPAVLDGALQASAGLWLGTDGEVSRSAEPALPFAVARVDVRRPTPTRAVAWVRYQPGSGPAERRPLLDVTVFDEQGRVCADLTGLSTRVLPEAAAELPQGRPEAAAELPQGRSEAPLADTGIDIAVIGVAGRYPAAADLDEFWENLRSGRDSVSRVPAGRWTRPRWAAEADLWGGFLDGIDLFDPLFFRISQREAEHLDPHERLFLECAHHVLEDAGYTGDLLERTSGGVGVFTGVMYQDYQLYGAQAQDRGQAVALSGSASSVANRVSFVHGFTGPSVAVDTMCSSSLTAIHLACEAIRRGECGAALAGGVNVTAHPNKYLMLQQRNYLSSDGRCRSFGAGGDGYVPGEGVGAVLLKPLDRALADGDHIHAVVKGTALNHGGRTNGYTVPNPAAQGRVVARALAASGVDPRTVGYIEAHGTGTSLGDPIEIAGLAKAFQEAGAGPERCAVGSVKSNIGHAESAAGIAGVTKVLLQMRHRELVPSLHATALNPHIDFPRTPLRVQRSLDPWQRPTVVDGGRSRFLPRTAGVSSFGAGGSNAHVVLAEYELPQPQPGPADRPALLVLSARTEAQLVEQALRLEARLAELTEAELPGVAWTLQTGRVALEERLAFAVDSLARARSVLTRFAAEPDRSGDWVRGTVLTEVAPDEAEQAGALDHWIREGDGDRLLRLWAAGTPVPWETVPTGSRTDGPGHPRGPEPRPRRVPLPGYPFARERCWIELDGPAPGDALPDRIAQQASGGDGRGPDGEVMLLLPGWTPGETEDEADGAHAFTAHHVTVVGALSAPEREELRAALPPGAECRFVTVADGPLDRQYTEAAQAVLERLQEVLRSGPRDPVLFQVALAGPAPAGPERDRLACLGGLSGLLRTAGLEDPRLHGQFVDCLDGAPPAAVGARLTAEARPGSGPEVRYRDGRRYTAVLRETEFGDAATGPWREDGVYLVTGGAGALGRIVAGDIAASVRRATVVLVGRSALSEEQQAGVDALRAAGLTVQYRRVDITDRTVVARLLADVIGEHGPLTGVLHGAGVLADRLVVGKVPHELERVLAPKVEGVVHLDELTRDQPLEFFVCFSSASGTLGNVGQADYAAANAFLDAYTAYRNLLVTAGERSGRTVSVGWPLWADGGMGANGAVARRLRDLDLASLETAQGLAVLRWALTDPAASGDGRLIVLAGRREALARLTGGSGRRGAADPRRPATAAATTAGAASDGDRLLEDRTVGHLRRLLADVLKIGPERLHPDAELERYGMDSLLAVETVTRLEKTFGPLSRTLLLELPTLRELTRYLAAEHPAALRVLLGEPHSVGESEPETRSRREPERRLRPESAAAPSPDATTRDATTTSAPDRAALPPTEPRGKFMDVAVIGIAGRYPQSADLDTLWTHLRDGKDCVTGPPADRWGEADRADRWGGFLDGIDEFDASLFGVSPREAAAMDPQQRLFLETVWELLEGCGTTQEVIEHQYRRSVGVYVGASYLQYRADDSDPALAALTSTASYNMIANRVSHFFGLEGPSLAVDSMCTSSAMALHLACADLQRGECEAAVVGGVNLAPRPDKFLGLSEMRMLGSGPDSRSFRDGDGYLPAEAVGAVLLKPLDAALRDGDEVHAVIKGTATLHGGRANGLLAPSRRAQVTVMRRALERSGIEAAAVGYVEASANGAALSDEIEVSALREVFDGVTEPVVVGSVKSNLGHPEAASGVAQLTKVALQFRHRELAPLVATGQTNPHLALADGPLTLCERLTLWEEREDADGRPSARRALINSVAAGGSHVSLVVEAPPRAKVRRAQPEDTGPQLLVLSAADPARLRTSAGRLLQFLGRRDAVSLVDIAYTLQLGREAMPARLAVVAASVEELRASLAAFQAGADGTAATDATPGPVLHTGNTDDAALPLMTLLDGPRGEAFVSGLVADRDLERLAELWVCGARIGWSGLYARRRRLVALPATVFERTSHWLGGTSVPRAPAAPAHRSDPAAPTQADPEPASEDRVPAPALAAPVPPPGRTPAGPERVVVEVCAELLGLSVEELGPEDSFFALGGHSLLAHHFADRLRERGLLCDPPSILRASDLADVARASRPVQAVRALSGAEPVSAPAVSAGSGASSRPVQAVRALSGAEPVSAPAVSAGSGASSRPAGIPAGTTRITPDLLPLASLTEQELAAVVAAAPGGAANLQDVYPLAGMQEGMLFHHVRDDAHDPYISSGLFSFADRDHLDQFVEALRAVIARHDVLRTVILSDGLGEPVQAVLRHVEFAPVETEFRPGTPAVDQLAELVRNAPRMPLDRGPLIRLQTGPEPETGVWHAALSLHNVLHDASSLGLLFAEVAAHMDGRADALPEPVHYRDFVAHTRLRPTDPEAAAFFTELLGDVTEPTVAFNLHDVHGDGRQVVEARRPLDDALGRRVRELAADLRTSPATLFHVGWALTLAACADRDDVVFGTVLSGRLRGPAGTDRMLGSFINTLPLRLDLAGRGVRDLVRRTGQLLHELVRHEQVPLTEARAHSGLPDRELPLFNAIFNYRHLPSDDGIAARLRRVGVTPLSDVFERSNFPVTVSVDDLGHAFRIDALIHRAQDADIVIDCLEAAMASLTEALSDEERALHPALDLPVLPAAMRERELVAFAWEQVTAEAADTRSERHVHAWFEEEARAVPNAVAVTCEDRSLTYAELNARANRLARHLRSLGVGHESLVALCLPRSEWLVVSALAVLKAGGAYVPLDPSAPVERLGHVVSDSAPKVVLVDGAVPEGLDVGGARVVDVPEDTADWDALSDADLEPVAGASPKDLAYVIYTSGSTGLPKGVMVEHRNVARFFVAAQEWFRYREGDVWTLFHSFAFDFTVWEMWGALLHRGRLVVVTRDVARSPRDFYRLLCTEGVTVLGQTPTGFGQLIAAQGDDGAPHRVRTVLLGGEELDAAPLAPWFTRAINDGTELVNMWGTTETTVVTTYRVVTEPDTRLTTRPIGGAMPGMSVYVLDRHGNPMPTGAVGELVIGGEAVSRGYLNRAELTAQRFVEDPFVGVPGARMYRTGDLGRRLADGSLEFLGRNDGQVKIRGYRIELGEISTRLNEHPAVAEARVVIRGQGDERRLIGYVVPADDRWDEPGRPREQELREQLDTALRAALPPYMVPSGYVLLDRLPLTGNGKLDTTALPEPEAPVRSGPAVALTGTERIVSEVWAELLRIDAGALDARSRFFEFGGNSLLVARLINLIKQRTGVELTVQTVFDANRLGDLAAALDRALPDTGAATALDLDAITESISLIESLSDTELDALNTGDAAVDIENRGGRR